MVGKIAGLDQRQERLHGMLCGGWLNAIAGWTAHSGRTPIVCGFSPIQWTLGYTPHIPGLLMEELSGNNPAHLDPSALFLEKLRLQQEAAKATAQADSDHRLRRAC